MSEQQEKIPCTVYVMTLNSGPDFRRTLESIKQFAEILVCDGNSTDGTQDMAREYGARVIPQTDSTQANRKMTDFSAVHNKCRVEAKYDWIFQLDHDEIMPPETADEIRQIVTHPIKHYVYQVPNVIMYKGRAIKHSSTYPGYEMRFFNRTCGAVYYRNPHSRLAFDKEKYPVGHLKNPFGAFEDGTSDIGRKYIGTEVRSFRGHSFKDFFRWAILHKISAMIKITLRALWIRLRHGTRDALPIKYDMFRLGHAFFVMTGAIRERIFGYDPSAGLNKDTKKILLVCEKVSIFYHPILTTLRSLGFYVEIIDPRDTLVLRSASIVHKIARRFPVPLRDAVFNNSQRTIDRRISAMGKALKPHYIFAVKAKSIALSVLDELKNDGAVLLNWYPDTMDNWTSIQNIVGHYNYFFNYDNYVVKLLREQGHKQVFHLPFAADMDKYASFPSGNREYGLSFLGSYHASRYPERLVFMEALKDLKLDIWGNKAWLDTDLAPFYHGWVTPHLESIMAIYKKSKIVIHSDLSPSLFPGTGVTLRPFDVTASGAFLLAHNDRAELFELFEDGKEFISFTDATDLRKKAEYYLKHEEERERIARAGFERVRRDHTYADRIKTIFDIIKHHENTDQ